MRGTQELPRRGRVGLACQLSVVVCWLLLLWDVTLPSYALLPAETGLCLVTLAAALSCWVRAVCTPGDRTIWAWMALGLSGYAIGFVILFGVSMGEAGGPFGINYSDCASLLLYPAGYVSLLLLTRDRVSSWQSSALLDGAIVALAASAVAITWAAASYPSLLGGSVLNVIYALAYPVGGATLLVVALTGLAMTRWQLDSAWVLILLGFAVMTVGDAIYGLQSAAGTFRFGTGVDAAYTAGPVLVALAAWRRPTRRRRRGNAAVAMVVPGVATLVALVLLVLDHVSRIPTLAIGLAAAAIVAAVGRTAFFLRQERQLVQSRRDAETDYLTGLPNRRALLAALRNRLTADWADVELLLVDLDGFKEVNDTLGHASGDRLLVEIADRFRSSPGCWVARLGGDEFAIVLTVSEGEPLARAHALRDLVDQALLIDGCQVSVGASVGLAGAGTGAPERLTPEELLRRADVALYRAKALRSSVETWTPSLDLGARDRLELLAELRLALASPDQIVVHHQPQVHPFTREVMAIEALVRWEHPRRGLLAPGAFLGAVEQAGLLPQLTLRVLDLVLQHQAQATATALGPTPPISVNVGAPDLLQPAFASHVERLLLRHGVPPDCLRIEVTEGVVMSDPDRILGTLNALQELGVTLSLDDYGTGLSSLSYLRTLPIDELKIDRSFVQRLTSDPATALIVSSTISLAHALGLRVVAEGVEDEPTLRALQEAGCDLVQGYLLGRPAPTTPVRVVPAPRAPLAVAQRS